MNGGNVVTEGTFGDLALGSWCNGCHWGFVLGVIAQRVRCSVFGARLVRRGARFAVGAALGVR